MPSLRFPVVALLTLLSCLALVTDGSAQSFTGDARTVATGGGGNSTNIALGMVDPAGRYIVIPIPIGLIQVLGNVHGFDPTSDTFDPAWALESASNPMHYTFGRKSSGSDDPDA